MSTGEYLVGLIAFALTWGAPLAFATLVARRRLPRLGGAPRILAFALVALAALIGEHLLPAMLGILDRWTASATGWIAVILAWRYLRRVPGAAHDDTPPPLWETGPVSWALAALAGAMLLV